MARTRRSLIARVCVLAIGACVLLPASALAFVTTDMIDWNLTDTASTYGGGTQFHISTGTDGSVSYRWLDVTDHTTVISGNSCADYSLLGTNTISSGNTSYHLLFWGTQGQCFVLRGRTAIGSGAMYNKDGRVQR